MTLFRKCLLALGMASALGAPLGLAPTIAVAQTMPSVPDDACVGIQPGGTVLLCAYDRQTGQTICVAHVC